MTENVLAGLDPGAARCLVFDWDGTLVDTSRANYLALSEALSGHGVALDEDWYNRRTGMSTDSMIDKWLTERGMRVHVPLADLSKRRDEIFLRTAAAVRPIEPVLRVARRYAGLLPLAVASGGTRVVIEPTMRMMGLDRLFDVLVTREDAAHGKPDPEIFLLAASRVGVRPEQCLVYEDSDEGVQAARVAGMSVIDIRPLLREGG
jgi:beta-phosphoglucomutase-like phosphatase (HAD superfamily)